MSAIDKKAKVAAIALVNSASTAYAVGDQLDGLQQITNALDEAGDTGIINSIIVVDKESASAAVDVLFFNDAPTVVSSDNVSLNISDADMESKFLGSVRVAAADYITTAASSVATVKNIGLSVNSIKSSTNLNGNSLWAILRSAGTPTWTGTQSLSLRIGILQDQEAPLSHTQIGTATGAVDSDQPKVTGTTIDADTHGLDVNIVGGSSAGTQYTEGDTDASITGTAALMEGAGNTLLPIQGTVADGLLVNLGSNNDVTITGSVTVTATNLDIRDLTAASDSVAVHGDEGILSQLDLTNSNPATVAIVDGNGDQITSFGGGVQYTEGDTDASITGTAMLWEDAGDTLATVSAVTPLPVNIVAGSSSGTEYTEGDTDASITGTAILMEGAANTLLPVQGTVADGLLVNLGANNDVTVTSSALPTGAATAANQTTIIGHVDGIEGLLTTIDADTSALAGTVSGTELQVDIVSAPTLTVQATNLDIRDLAAASDSVSIHGDVGILSQLDLANSNPANVAIVDANGDQITSFGGGVQYTEGDTDASITGTAAMMEVSGDELRPIQGTVADGLLVNLGSNNDVTVTSSALPTGAATAANQTTIIGHVDGIEALLTTIDADTSALAGTVSGTELQVDVLTMPTTTVQATNLDIRDLVFASDKVDVSGSTLGSNSGVDIGDVTINNASGAAAVNIQDGGNTITVDGTVGVSGNVSVVGPAADGAAVSGNPVRVAGKDGSGNTQDIITHTDGRVWNHTGFVSTSNSRANANLAGAATFNGTFEDITQYAGFSLGILDAGANGGTLTINWSEDGVNTRDTDVVVVPTANGQQFTWGRKWQFFQVSYTHGAGAGNVVIQTILHTSSINPSTHFGSDTITTGQDGQLVIAALRALSGSSFVNVLADSAGALIATQKTASTATLSNVSGSASNVTLLSANSARLGASIYNDSTAILYVKFGTTASTTSFNVKMFPEDYFEVPDGYTGRIDGIWASATGAARMSELTA